MTTAKWILEAYERAAEEDRMEMYMLYRDLREEFEQMDTGTQARGGKKTGPVSDRPAGKKLRWHGRLRKVFGST